jgi:hypothetical protein
MGVEQMFRDLLQGNLSNADSFIGEERRKEARLTCDPVPIRIVIDGIKSLPVSAHVMNVAESGLGLRLDKDVQVYPGVMVVVDVHSLRITGRVRHCVPMSDTEWLNVGVQIENAELIQ